MTYHGRVKNGQIVLDTQDPLPEGAEVRVELTDNGSGQPTLWDKLRGLAGSVEGPEDWARNHDHHIHGTPKRP